MILVACLFACSLGKSKAPIESVQRIEEIQISGSDALNKRGELDELASAVAHLRLDKL